MIAQTERIVWDPQRYRFSEDRHGGLEIWKHPQPDELFVAGIDTSAGGSQSDFACLAMIETRSRALVAMWHGLYDPQQWGIACARLGLYYNNALLAFETHPSQHGLTAVLSARDFGYANLYRRREMGMVTARVSEELGWATTVKTKPLLVDKVRVALSENWEIPSEHLLRQLLGAKRDKSGNLAFDGHDDRFIAYAIAQVVADDAVAGGFVSSAPKQEYQSWEKRWWEHRRRLLSGQDGTDPGDGERAYDGL